MILKNGRLGVDVLKDTFITKTEFQDYKLKTAYKFCNILYPNDLQGSPRFNNCVKDLM
jgi:hypothetical protein